ncbi:MAG: hypothetical protein ORN58_02180, partial [Sediminibacterium sp.]|nr:hypothetical protein [Sediminibacterium sp.]
MKNIVLIQLNELKKLINQNGLEINFGDSVIQFLSTEGYDLQMGARPLKRLIQKEIINILSKLLLSTKVDKNKPIQIEFEKDTL